MPRVKISHVLRPGIYNADSEQLEVECQHHDDFTAAAETQDLSILRTTKGKLDDFESTRKSGERVSSVDVH